MMILKNFQYYLFTILIILSVFFLGLLFFYNIVFPITTNIQFTHLAYSILEGKINLVENIKNLPHPSSYYDLILLNGKYYWHQGPFPAGVIARTKDISEAEDTRRADEKDILVKRRL